MKCNVCGTEFTPVKERHFAARDAMTTGLSTALSREEPEYYDAFDCPNCGCQVIAQVRKRVYVGDKEGK